MQGLRRVLAGLTMLLVCIAVVDAQLGPQQSQARQVEMIGERLMPAPAPDAPAEETTDESQSTEDIELAEPAEPKGPAQHRIHLDDGSIITGKLAVPAFTVKTEYGLLTVPVEDVNSIIPGLETRESYTREVKMLVKSLGAASYGEREAAQKRLLDMGPSVIPLVDRYGKTTEAEVQKRVEELLLNLESQASLMSDEDREFYSVRDEDSLVTPHFKVVGKVQPSQIQVDSKYGKLTVKLEDVKQILQVGQDGPTITKQYSVSGEHRAMTNWLDTGLKLERGAEVMITARGQITMSPWGGGYISTPDGAMGIGWYSQNQIPFGALVGRIGDNGETFMIGKSSRFKAERSGKLYLGFAMNQNYGNNQFPGNYDVMVRINKPNK